MKSVTTLSAALCLLALPAFSQTVDRIRETGTLKLGFRTDAAPLSFLNDGEGPAGYTPRVCAAVAENIAEQIGLETLDATFFPVDASDRFEKVASGEIDLLCGAATITLERRALVDFSAPVYVDGTAVLLPKGANPSLEDLKGKKVGVRSDTTTATTLTNTLVSVGIDAEIVKFGSHPDGLAAMETSEIDAYFADQSILLGLLATTDAAGALGVTNNILTIEKQGLALQHGDSEFRLMVDRALSHLYDSGQMDAIFKETLPHLKPGTAISAMRLIAPTMP